MAAIKRTIDIPETGNRLANTIALYGAAYDGTKKMSDADFLQIPLVEMGAVLKFKYKNDRSETKVWRVFGRNKNGKIEGSYPGLGGYVLLFETIVLYRDSLVNQLGFSDADIMIMNKPLIIQAVLLAPGDIPIRTMTFPGVWFENNELSFDAEADDLRMAYEINAKASGIIEG